jgi:class 3 adenylate cyclase/pimeloyl-ACP methyl ester carboxylesterase
MLGGFALLEPGRVFRIAVVEIPPEVRYAVRDGKSIAYQRWGSGERCVVAIGAALGNLDLVWVDPALYDAFVSLGHRALLIMYDQLGQGLSDPVDHVPTLEERASDLAAVIDAGGFETATVFAIFDACLGALVYAAQHPERVEGLVLWNPFVQGWRSADVDQLEGWDDREQVEAYERAWEDVHQRWGTGASLSMQMPALATRSNVRLWGLLERAAVSPGMIRTIHQSTFAADVRDILPLVSAPVLVLRSVGHRLPEAVTRRVVDLLPNATYQELSETSSMAEFFAAAERQIQQHMFGGLNERRSHRALMTVMFTDIVASTERAVQVGDNEWRQVLDDHERVVRSEVQAAGGRVVQFIGDGSLSTFDGPARGIRCAQSIVAGTRELGLDVRAGLHTGECELRQRDIAGITVHIAARVSALADAGQVLVSRTVKDLVTGSGIALAPHGTHALKGVPQAWELFSVGESTTPLPAPDQLRDLTPTDRLALQAARRTPALLRAAARLRARHPRP